MLLFRYCFYCLSCLVLFTAYSCNADQACPQTRQAIEYGLNDLGDEGELLPVYSEGKPLRYDTKLKNDNKRLLFLKDLKGSTVYTENSYPKLMQTPAVKVRSSIVQSFGLADMEENQAIGGVECFNLDDDLTSLEVLFPDVDTEMDTDGGISNSTEVECSRIVYTISESGDTNHEKEKSLLVVLRSGLLFERLATGTSGGKIDLSPLLLFQQVPWLKGFNVFLSSQVDAASKQSYLVMEFCPPKRKGKAISKQQQGYDVVASSGDSIPMFAIGKRIYIPCTKKENVALFSVIWQPQVREGGWTDTASKLFWPFPEWKEGDMAFNFEPSAFVMETTAAVLAPVKFALTTMPWVASRVSSNTKAALYAATLGLASRIPGGEAALQCLYDCHPNTIGGCTVLEGDADDLQDRYQNAKPLDSMCGGTSSLKNDTGTSCTPGNPDHCPLFCREFCIGNSKCSPSLDSRIGQERCEKARNAITKIFNPLDTLERYAYQCYKSGPGVTAPEGHEIIAPSSRCLLHQMKVRCPEAKKSPGHNTLLCDVCNAAGDPYLHCHPLKANELVTPGNQLNTSGSTTDVSTTDATTTDAVSVGGFPYGWVIAGGIVAVTVAFSCCYCVYKKCCGNSKATKQSGVNAAGKRLPSPQRVGDFKDDPAVEPFITTTISTESKSEAIVIVENELPSHKAVNGVAAANSCMDNQENRQSDSLNTAGVSSCPVASDSNLVEESQLQEPPPDNSMVTAEVEAVIEYNTPENEAVGAQAETKQAKLVEESQLQELPPDNSMVTAEVEAVIEYNTPENETVGAQAETKQAKLVEESQLQELPPDNSMVTAEVEAVIEYNTPENEGVEPQAETEQANAEDLGESMGDSTARRNQYNIGSGVKPYPAPTFD